MTTIFLIWAILATIGLGIALWALYNPTKFAPLWDRGHRGFEVTTLEQRDVLLRILLLGGLQPAMQFQIGPTDQTVMSDGMTVVNLHNHDDPHISAKFPGTFISLVTESPEWDAKRARDYVADHLNTPREELLIEIFPVPDKPPVVAVYMKPLGMTITFRASAIKLGKPPGAKML